MTTPTPGPAVSVDYTDDATNGRAIKQGRLRGVTAGATVALALVAGVIAFAQLSGAAGDGADSPEAAVEALFAALAAEDLDAAVDVLVPDERPVLVDPLYEMLDELVRIGLLSDELDTSAISGVDLDIADLVLTVTQVDDDLANVHSSGSLVADFLPDELPLGSPILSFLDRMGALDELSPATETTPIDMTITTVRRDGRWYVSLFHSIGEHARLEAGAPPMERGAIEPRGAGNPEEAIDELLAAASALDIAGLVAMINPAEVPALYHYAPLLIEQAQADPPTAEFSLDDVRYTVDQQGDRAVVNLTSYTLTAAVEGFRGTEILTYRWADGCYHMSEDHTTADGDVVSNLGDGPPPWFELPPGMSYADGVMTVCPAEAGAASSGFANVPPFGLDPLGIGSAGQVVVLDRVDGHWYVSPASTLTYGWLEGLREIDSIAELLAPLIMPFGPGVTYSESFEAVPGEIYPTDTTIVAP